MAEQQAEKEITEIKASAKGVHVSPRKARLVIELIKGLSVDEALDQLRFAQKAASKHVVKLINAAVANAEHNFEVDKGRLFVKNVNVDGGPFFKRYKPRAQGRAFSIRKRTSHFHLVLGVSEEPLSTESREDQEATADSKTDQTDESGKPKKTDQQQGAETADEDKENENLEPSKPKSDKKKEPKDQQKPKIDPAAATKKQRTGFDRKSNM